MHTNTYTCTHTDNINQQCSLTSPQPPPCSLHTLPAQPAHTHTYTHTHTRQKECRKGKRKRCNEFRAIPLKRTRCPRQQGCPGKNNQAHSKQARTHARTHAHTHTLTYTCILWFTCTQYTQYSISLTHTFTVVFLMCLKWLTCSARTKMHRCTPTRSCDCNSTYLPCTRQHVRSTLTIGRMDMRVAGED